MDAIQTAQRTSCIKKCARAPQMKKMRASLPTRRLPACRTCRKRSWRRWSARASTRWRSRLTLANSSMRQSKARIRSLLLRKTTILSSMRMSTTQSKICLQTDLLPTLSQPVSQALRMTIHRCIRQMRPARHLKSSPRAPLSTPSSQSPT